MSFCITLQLAISKSKQRPEATVFSCDKNRANMFVVITLRIARQGFSPSRVPLLKAGSAQVGLVVLVVLVQKVRSNKL